MAQYTEISSGIPFEISEGIKEYRYRVSAGTLQLDQTITATGFSGFLNIDWENLEVITAGGNMAFRIGVRDIEWVIDETLDGTGFSGTENVNWVNIESHSLGLSYLTDPDGNYILDPNGYRIILPL